MDKKIILILFILLINIAYAGLPDKDKDGVPDEKDLCPYSGTLIVDGGGCSCRQKTAISCTINCCKQAENPCLQQCGESSGEAICNLWNYEKCPVENTFNQTKDKEDISSAKDSASENKEITVLNDISKELVGEVSKKDEIIEKTETIEQEKAAEKTEQEEVAEGEVAEDDRSGLPRKQSNEISPTKTGKAYQSPNKELKSDNFDIVQIMFITIPIILLIIIIILLLYYLNKRKKKLNIIKNYLQQNILKGYPLDALQKHLIDHGWDKRLVDKAVRKMLKK